MTVSGAQSLRASKYRQEAEEPREQGAQERGVQRVVYVDGLVARGEDADPGRPLQQRRRRLLALEDCHQRLRFGL